MKISEGCSDYLSGGPLDDNDRRYDEVMTPLVEEENQIRHKDFSKLNLPPEELLRTETSRDAFPERNKPVEKSIKIDTEALKTAGSGIVSKARSIYDKVVEIRNQRQQQQEVEKETEKSAGPENGMETEVTHLREALKREPKLKTIEQLKKPELASFPIRAPKTAEAIQDDEEENVEVEIKEIKKIVVPDVAVPKELPQPQKDPFILSSPAPSDGKKPTDIENKKKPSWVRKQASVVWESTKSVSKRLWMTMKESDILGQVILGGIGAGGV